MDKLEGMYLKTTLPQGLKDPMPGDIRAWVLTLIRTDLNQSASPGYPLCVRYQRNSDVPPDVWQDVADVVVLRLALLHRLSDGDLDLAAIDLSQFLVAVGAADPVRMFVKNEPHAARKLDKKAYRLISSVSVADQLVSRILNGRLNEWEIENFTKIPSQPGMGLEDEDLCRMVEWLAVGRGPLPDNATGRAAMKWLSSGPGLVSTDISGFDWNVTLWQLRDEAHLRCRLYGLLRADKAWSLIHGRTTALAHAVFVLSDGTMFAQAVPGLQKSGDYTTSSANSRIMTYTLVLSGATRAWTMGDDAVSVDTDEATLRHYLDVKEFQKSTECLTFCSHKVGVGFHDGYLEPEYTFLGWRKAAYRLLSTCPLLQTGDEQGQLVLQFEHCMRFMPAERSDVLLRLRPHVKASTQEYIDQILDDD